MPTELENAIRASYERGLQATRNMHFGNSRSPWISSSNTGTKDEYRDFIDDGGHQREWSSNPQQPLDGPDIQTGSDDARLVADITRVPDVV